MITYTEVTADSGARALFPIILNSKNMAEVKLYIPALHESGYWRIKDINKDISDPSNREWKPGKEKILIGSNFSDTYCFYAAFDEGSKAGTVRVRFYCTTENGIESICENINGNKWYIITIDRYNNGTNNTSFRIKDDKNNIIIEKSLGKNTEDYDEKYFPELYIESDWNDDIEYHDNRPMTNGWFEVWVSYTNQVKIKYMSFYEFIENEKRTKVIKNRICKMIPCIDSERIYNKKGFSNFAFPLKFINFNGIYENKNIMLNKKEV